MSLSSKHDLRPGYRPSPPLRFSVNTHHILFVILIACAILSRFYMLGDRALSHDEGVHLYYSYLFSEGKGYSHTPLSHGPFQFHVIALLFFLFGSSDFLGRVPQAVASVATLIFLWKWRRYLGRYGTLVSVGLMVISPFMLYYGRYARNESFVALIGVITLYAVLRYFETKEKRYLILLTVSTAFHFTVKETAFIYTGQLLLFLLGLLLFQVSKLSWSRQRLYRGFVSVLFLELLLFIIAVLIQFLNGSPPFAQSPWVNFRNLSIVFVIILSVIAGFLLLLGYGWRTLRQHASFDILILLGTFVLPQLSAFPISWIGLNPLDYHFNWPGWNLSAIFAQTPPKIGLIFFGLFGISVLVGLFWSKKQWPFLAVLFWGIYLFFFTSFFSNPAGFFTGSIGSLGYWLEQQSFQRGGQPWFYYLLVQIPTYEFLPFLGLIPAIYFGIKHYYPHTESPSRVFEIETNNKSLFFPLLLWWTISSIAAYSIAGERMPWLTVHITLPMILLSGWGIGILLERANSGHVHKKRWIIFAFSSIGLMVFIFSFIGSVIKYLLPFQGNLIIDSSITSNFITLVISSLTLIIWIQYATKKINKASLIPYLLLVCFGYLAILTTRTSYRAAITNAENAMEYLVYAHGASGIKDALQTITLISERVSGRYNELIIAFDAGGETQGVSWPWKWYMRNFPNAYPFYSTDASLLGADVVISDPQSFDDLDKTLGNGYFELNTLRMVWPNQDYFSLSPTLFIDSLLVPNQRVSLFEIWYNRDYSLYGQTTGTDGFTSFDWYPSDKFRIYIRKDLVHKVWEVNSLQH